MFPCACKNALKSGIAWLEKLLEHILEDNQFVCLQADNDFYEGIRAGKNCSATLPLILLLHGHAEIQNFSLSVEKYFMKKCNEKFCFFRCRIY